MPKLIALDYGSKRTGIAVTDDSKIIASGLTTVDSKDLLKFLRSYFETNVVTDIILGLPKRLDGSETHSSQAVEELRVKLINVFGKPVHM
jgi:putative Holliday junction resolvase